jgi:hypothetical protein|tara:strand:- start:456 stop:719 length:264 start_codon:yes stop_codon:yes gene_type:complete
MLRFTPKLRKVAVDNKTPKRIIIFPVTFGMDVCMIAEYKNQRRRPKIETKPAKRKLSVYIDIIKAIIADAGIKKPMPILMLSFILIL